MRLVRGVLAGENQASVQPARANERATGDSLIASGLVPMTSRISTKRSLPPSFGRTKLPPLWRKRKRLLFAETRIALIAASAGWSKETEQ